MRIRYLFFQLVLITSGAVSGQETLVDLGCNPVLVEHANKIKLQKAVSKTSPVVQGGSLAIPFIEDFSKEGVYPDPVKWQDSNVFINRTFPKAPPTLGVATFDGLRSNGLAYNMNVSSGSSDTADYLTSKPIDLSAAVDSVYLSFFYQAQGRGNAPETKDSLLLDFRLADNTWVKAWAKAGYQLSTNDSTFNYVNLYVPSQFYHANFQFRFWNYATLSGNVDHWHIDMIRLDDQRNYNDPPIYNDITFVYPAPRLLKTYTAMPYRQYTTAEADLTYWNPIRNNFNLDIPAAPYTLTVKDEAGNPTIASLDNRNIEPYNPNGYTICVSPTACPGLLYDTISYTYPALTDCTHFTVTQKIRVQAADIIPSNDSVSTVVNFHNYYAYDDGTAEAAWGVYSAFALVAYKFSLTYSDTLRAVSIFWNPYVSNAQTHAIRITVWNDNSGQPGQILYQSPLTYPEYQLGYNGFKYHMLDDTLLNLSGTFYIGYMQIDPETLSVGMDMNTNVQSKIFYNTSGTWFTTTYKAAMMMRPHFGEAFVPMSVNGTRPTRPSSFRIYPNPASDRVHIVRSEGSGACRVNVFDAYGRQVMNEQTMTGEHSLDVSELTPGMYFIRIEAAGKVSAHRMVITR
jgi:hypothetical protein